MDQSIKIHEMDGSIKLLDLPTDDSRRQALQKIAKYSAYLAPALLATISGKASAAS
jgi:hypothetical protein